jgi:hypothetical protein
MLRCVIQLVPQGDETKARTIGTIIIGNDLTGDLDTGNYDVRLTKGLVGKHGATWRRGRVEGFPRRRLGPYDLVLRALQATVGGRR